MIDTDKHMNMPGMGQSVKTSIKQGSTMDIEDYRAHII